jgi:hypothetical protein
MEIYKKRTAANRSSLIPSASPFATVSHFFFYALTAFLFSKKAAILPDWEENV